MTKILIDRSVVEQALEAFEIHARQYPHMVKGYTLDAEEALRAALEQPQANQPAMTPIAQRKLDSLLTEGYTISGYSIYHEQKHQHGFVTGAGLVGWWKPEGMEYPQPKLETLTDNQIDRIAESMPGGLEGFLKGWGWRQFARAVLEATHNIK